MNKDLSLSYGGIRLKNPIVVGASNIVTNPDNLEKLEEAGAGAIVYKSLFEEQIALESLQLEQKLDSYRDWDVEHSSFFPTVKHAGPAEHLRQLREARKRISIPLIGSLNCVHDETWAEYAIKMQDTGIDGLELNLYDTNLDFDTPSDTIENRQMKTLELVRASTSLPIFVKLSPYYTNTLRHISKLDNIGVDGFILFNRLFQPDIDVSKEEHHYPYNFSNDSDSRLALRYAGLLHKKTSASIISNTGILSGRDVIKMLLAGADAVQVVSAIYKKGIPVIPQILEELETWMERKGYQTLDDFRGKLSKENLPDPFAYKRAQYVDILMKSEIFMQYHPKHGELDNKYDEY